MTRQRQGGWLGLFRLRGLRGLGGLSGLNPFANARPFQPSEHFLQRKVSVTPPANNTALATRYWVLSRACYTVRIVSLADVPADKQANAIALAAAAWTPFANTVHYVMPQQKSVVICAWDANAVASAQENAGVAADDVVVVPETALREKVTGAGEQLVMHEALDGVVATLHQENQVQAEQWWAATPSVETWLNFQRSIGLDESQRATTLSLQKPTWQKTPVGYLVGQVQSTTSSRERWILAIAAWLLLIPTLWFANEWRQLNQLKNAALAKLATTERELDATLGARGQAIAGLDRVTKISNLFAQPDNVVLFALVNDVLNQTTQAGTLQLSEWDLRGAQLKIALIAPNGGSPSATTLVKAFEKAQTLRDVEVNVDGTRTTVTMRVVPLGASAVEASAPIEQSGGKK
jgi:hypothetical protein